MSDCTDSFTHVSDFRVLISANVLSSLYISSLYITKTIVDKGVILNTTTVYLKHERVRGMHKNGGVVLGRGLKAELGIGGAGVVRKSNCGGQLAIVQQHLVVLGKQQVAFGLVLERPLRSNEERQDEEEI